jgi:O-antigen ligase
MLGFFIFTVIICYLEKRKFSFYKKLSFWIPSSFFILSAFGLLFTSNLKNGWGMVETQAGLLFFPFIFTQLTITEQEFNRFKKWFLIFFFVLLFALEIRVFWLLGHSTEMEFGKYFFSYYFTYENFTTEYLIQPVYVGIFIVTANLFCFSFLLSATGQNAKLFFLLSLLLNNFFLFQIAARGPLILNLFLMIACVLYFFYLKRRLVAGVLVVVGIVAVAGSLFLSSGFARLRMQGFLTEVTAENLKEADPTSRLLIWPCAIEVIKASWPFGVGTGDAENSLMEVYKKKGYEELIESRLNTHNQYFTLLMRHGILGVLVVVLSLLVPIFFYVRSRSFESIFFTILIAGFFITENVLTRAQGVLFFAFFHSINIAMAVNGRENENTGLRN